MLRKIHTDHREFEFVTPRTRASNNDNIFTVIVGKNGTGKSRLLRSVVAYFLQDNPQFYKADLSRTEKLIVDPTSIQRSHSPSRIICVSMNPFDKFPLPKRSIRSDFYSYLGLRQLSTVDFGLAYLARIMNTLIESILDNSDRVHAILGILDYLKYVPEIHATFQWISARTVQDIIDRGVEYVVRERNGYPMMSMGMTDFIPTLWEFIHRHPKNEEKLIATLKKYHLKNTRTRLGTSLIISPDGLSRSVRSAYGDIESMEDFLLLIRSGVFRLKDIKLWKGDRHYSSEIKMSEASSGEQSVLMSLMGIASQIRNDSLICIDEPEVCLHPEWQERYIELLHSTFRQYAGCHFLIATHSPQIVAQLPTENCYVTQMETGRAHSSERSSNHSIDFQLARVFKAPGYQNEYLTRLALNTIVRVSKNKAFDSQSKKDYSILLDCLTDLRDNDPLADLILSLREMKVAYE